MEAQQKKEQLAVKEKYKNQRKNLKIEMNKEMEIIKKRYNNVKKDIDAKYKNKKLKLDKTSPVKKPKPKTINYS